MKKTAPQGNDQKVPNGFDLIALYGRNTGYSDKNDDCRVYHLNNETGVGTITVYHVFRGIRAAFNDIHMEYCNQEQNNISNMIEINHCTEGRFECNVGDRFCCYMSHGDMAIKGSSTCSEGACFPTRHYHGISIFIEADLFSEEFLFILQMLSIDFNKINSLVSNKNKIVFLRKNETASHIFSELYTVRETHRAGYLKLKILELLLFLTDTEIAETVDTERYFDRNSVSLIKSIHDLMISDIQKHYTIQELADRFDISPTTLKKNFSSIYGTSIYAYLKTYRIQEAQKKLLRTELSIAEIANAVGYENPAKFSSAFQKECGMPPSAFRKYVRSRIEHD